MGIGPRFTTPIIVPEMVCVTVNTMVERDHDIKEMEILWRQWSEVVVIGGRARGDGEYSGGPQARAGYPRTG